MLLGSEVAAGTGVPFSPGSSGKFVESKPHKKQFWISRGRVIFKSAATR